MDARKTWILFDSSNGRWCHSLVKKRGVFVFLLFSMLVFAFKLLGLFGLLILRRGVREACNDQIRYGSRELTLPR